MWPFHPTKTLSTSLAWALMNLKELAWPVFFNSSGSSLPYLTDRFFLSNVSDLLTV
uniref:Uncharacterized protein n=1 Tax=Lepeophtheirus salmonis TaxID=72036 RepID=A0A0K2V205_LEPSM